MKNANDPQAAYRYSRRDFLARSSGGLALAAMSSLMGPAAYAEPRGAARPGAKGGNRGALDALHFAPRAKRVIYLFQSGGPSHLDLFDHKPRLTAENGKDLPKSVKGEQRVTLMSRNQKRFPCFGSPFKFAQHGESGHWFSDIVPHMASISDELCFLKALQSEPINHDPAMSFMQTGRGVPGRPAMGSWLHYGLGSEAANLPAYVVMTSGVTQQPILSRYYHSGFLPSKYQGVQFQSTGDPVLFIGNPSGIDHGNRGRIIGSINKLNRLKHKQVGDPEIEARIDAYELAYQMQISVPELTDFSDEPKHILDMYGPDVRNKGTFAYQCLLARRLAERGVRFVQLFHAGWDQHGNLRKDIVRQTKRADQPSAALVMDLKMRGMLDDTLVMWGGEFGRTAYTQGKNGRDHHPRCFSVWLAGGGIKGGTSLGETDDYGYNVNADITYVRDLHATMLHCLGIDHQRLTYRVQGLDAKLTGVEPARVLKQLLV